jgi:hypothetical protein
VVKNLGGIQSLPGVDPHALFNERSNTGGDLEFLCKILLVLMVALKFDGHLHAIAPIRFLY